jgi:hypothetical protein
MMFHAVHEPLAAQHPEPNGHTQAPASNPHSPEEPPVSGRDMPGLYAAEETTTTTTTTTAGPPDVPAPSLFTGPNCMLCWNESTRSWDQIQQCGFAPDVWEELRRSRREAAALRTFILQHGLNAGQPEPRGD